MSIFRNIVFVAALAGLVAGLAMAVMQQLATVPLILDAEVYEEAAAAAEEAALPAGVAHEHEEEAWSPEGFSRFLFTVVANVATAIGFGLLLVVAMEIGNGGLGWRMGMFWGMAGFLVFTVAPGLGLPPELPAMPAADLMARQVWWVGTAMATAVGLALLFLFRTPPLAVLGIILILAPHIIGAPQPASHESPIPESLHHDYVVLVWVTSFVFWSLLGAAAGVLRPRFGLGQGALAAPGGGRAAPAH